MPVITHVTDQSREAIIEQHFAPLEIVSTSFDATSAVAAVRVPLTKDNADELHRVYEIADSDRSVTIAQIIEHDGSINAVGRRKVSWTAIPEYFKPPCLGAATHPLLDALTHLLPCPTDEAKGALTLHWAHDWRNAARNANRAPFTLRYEIFPGRHPAQTGVRWLRDLATVEDSQRAYIAARENSGLGGSQFGDGDLFDKDGQHLGRISYNGRLWPPVPWQKHIKPIAEAPNPSPGTYRALS